MIKEINLKNWKSFKELNFKFENINILIGGNASGKTNFLDALELIKLGAIDSNSEEINKIRGERNFFKTFNAPSSSIQVMFTKAKLEYEFDLTISNENLIKSNLKDPLSQIDPSYLQYSEDLSKTLSKLGSSEFLKAKDFSKEQAQLKIISKLISKINERRRTSLNQIKDIIILDPIPREVRGKTRVSKEEFIRKDCSNLISFILYLDPKIKNKLEVSLLKYLKKLLGENIQKIEFVTLGENQEFCQLYIHENIGGAIQKIHSDIISDGTLRYISIITALLVQPKETILAIEEFDNGIAPSKTKMLLDIIDELSLKNNFDVVVTTHNTNLMNYMSNKLFEFVFFTYRDNDGYSHIKRIRDIKRISKMMSYGEIGDLMENNSIIDFINLGDKND